MCTYKNVTIKENFQAHIKWADQSIKPVNIEQKTVLEWEVNDRFGNTWIIIFSGNVGEFLIKNKSTIESPFAVYLYLSGDQFEIVKAIDSGRNIRSERLLKKYKYLALMVSNYFKFNMLKT